ncbi:MAG TPA: hypothetical protein VN698_07765 [Bacteroidia bacterium]|nr:hypothetical protein [Bacteroidia bacterium]
MALGLHNNILKPNQQIFTSWSKKSATLKKLLPVSIAFLFTACSSAPANFIIKQTQVEFAQHPSYIPLTIEPPQKCWESGIDFDKATITNDSIGADNLLAVSIFFYNDYQDTLIAKVYDNNHNEKARISVPVNAKQDESQLIKFHFNRRVNIIPMDNLVIE